VTTIPTERERHQYGDLDGAKQSPTIPGASTMIENSMVTPSSVRHAPEPVLSRRASAMIGKAILR
jgi:hypothetical protein